MNLFKKKPKKFFTEQEESQIVGAIKQAELNTSGEIKVHVESKCADHAFERAIEVFASLQMDTTRQRNGVLFYLALEDHKFAIIADTGINEEVQEGFWQEIKQQMQADFKKGKVAEGLSSGILATGQALRAYFPYQENDENEISDDISKGE